MRILLLALLATSALAMSSLADEALQIAVNELGLQSLKYRGVEYCAPTGTGAVGFTGGAAAMLNGEKQPGKFADKPTSTRVAGTTVTQTYLLISIPRGRPASSG